ncbi:MAG: hypothetical protein PHQ64_01895 [Bacilli bacterium]|nr:hypothetical protein [Bacilli bacterium]
MVEDRIKILKKELFDLRLQAEFNKRNTEISQRIEKEIEKKHNELKRTVFEKETIEKRR